jgi:membrane protease YdiL (CAAX protease family)
VDLPAIIVILIQLVVTAVFTPEPESGADDPVGDLLMEIQGRYLVGAAELMDSGGMLYSQAQAFNVGSVGQRLRFVVLAAELSGSDEARRQLTELEKLIEEEQQRMAGGDAPLVIDEDLEAAMGILARLYPFAVDEEESTVDTAALGGADRLQLTEALGWFGELALAPPGGEDEDLRSTALAPAVRTFLSIFIAFIVAGAVGFGGFIGLIVMVVLAFMRKLRGGIEPGKSHHGIYAETFAIWLPGFFLLQLGAAAAAEALSGPPLILAFIAFIASLGVLAWPIMRGIPWRQMCLDIGWTRGRARGGVWTEVLCAPLGYAMTLPLLAVGVLLTFLLLLIDTALAGPAPPLAPAGGPAHPIIVELAGGNLLLIAQILLIGSVAAPIVEETMFRGVLYRHLRDASAGVGFIVSVLIGTLVNSFVFAIIHPQGWVAVPALMSLAIGFTLVREWRGSLIAAMVMHGLSNGIVLGLLSLITAW